MAKSMSIAWGWLHASWMVHVWYGIAMAASVIIGTIVGKKIGFKDVPWGYVWAGVIILAIGVCALTLYYMIYGQ
jgi:energy-converting hydrogenase Eha subunit A